MTSVSGVSGGRLMVGRVSLDEEMAMRKRSGTKLIKQFPEGEHIVGMLEFGGQIYIATDKMVYVLEGEEIVPAPIHMPELSE